MNATLTTTLIRSVETSENWITLLAIVRDRLNMPHAVILPADRLADLRADAATDDQITADIEQCFNIEINTIGDQIIANGTLGQICDYITTARFETMRLEADAAANLRKLNANRFTKREATTAIIIILAVITAAAYLLTQYGP